MKIGIIGPAQRALAWEEHLAGHSTVSEIVIAGNLQKAGSLNACLLIDEDLEEALTAVKKGIHVYVISKLPYDADEIEKLYHASQEANVRLQFSHWATLALTSQFCIQKISAPSFIQTIREVNYTTFLENNLDSHDIIIDELAYCLKYIDSSIYQTNFNNSVLGGHSAAGHALLKFDNGATASIFVNTAADCNKHKRVIADRNFLIECDIKEQRIRIGRKAESDHLFFDRKEFDASQAAEQSVIKFLKAIRLKKSTLYNGYDLLRLSKILERMKLK